MAGSTPARRRLLTVYRDGVTAIHATSRTSSSVNRCGGADLLVCVVSPSRSASTDRRSAVRFVGLHLHVRHRICDVPRCPSQSHVREQRLTASHLHAISLRQADSGR